MENQTEAQMIKELQASAESHVAIANILSLLEPKAKEVMRAEIVRLYAEMKNDQENCSRISNKILMLIR